MTSFSNLSLRARIVVVSVVLTTLVVGVLFVLYGFQARSQAVESFTGKAQAINLMAESARMEMEEKLAAGVIDVQQIRHWAAQGEKEKIPLAVPVVTAWRAAMRKAKEAGYIFKVPKVQPRNPLNQPDPLESEALAKMEAENQEELTVIDEAGNSVRSFRAVRLTKTCLMCHGDPKDSKEYWGNDQGLDPFGGKMEDWKEGELHGAFEIIQSLDQADRELRTNLLFGALVVFAGLVLSSLLFILVITRTVNRPVERVTEELSTTSDQVASASAEISSSSQSLADGASNQAASLEETSASLEELSSMTRQNADHASQADKLMGETRGVVERAGRSLEQMSRSMAEISLAGQEISKIIKTIDEIAFQTNLLALNAAVEAARAGEAGAGFAVVADEVRGLAQRSAEAARNTSGLIVNTINKINQGSQLVGEVREAFAEVNAAAEKVGGLVGDVASASSEQAQGIDQINQAVAALDKVIQENAAQAEESAAASEELGAQAESLRGIVLNLGRMVKGGQ
ncbi:MAG: methyl-accepting chemotaxis protein [Thermodesulfobacteriota bacterium]